MSLVCETNLVMNKNEKNTKFFSTIGSHIINKNEKNVTITKLLHFQLKPTKDQWKLHFDYQKKKENYKIFNYFFLILANNQNKRILIFFFFFVIFTPQLKKKITHFKTKSINNQQKTLHFSLHKLKNSHILNQDK